MPRTRNQDGIDIPLTDEEETARDAEEKAVEDAKPAKAWGRLRRDRNEKLAETDFYGISDLTMSNDMKAYRKALRDLPATLNNTTVLQTITWPTKP